MPARPQTLSGATSLNRRHALALGGLALGSSGLAAVVLPAVADTPAGLETAFEEAAARYAVPRDLLVAIGYAETRLRNHGGEPSMANGFGVMHLVHNPRHRTLDLAARLTGLAPARLKRYDAANIAGAAAVLDAYATRAGLTGGARRDLGAWYPVVARYSGAQDAYVRALYADSVNRALTGGAAARGVRVDAREVEPRRGRLAARALRADGAVAAQSEDYPPALWVPASSSNYTAADRPNDHPIEYVVIHTTQGSYAGSISWFQNPSAQVSAHYVIRSEDGEVTQMVRHADYAWHAGNREYNQRSIGIEHEGFVDDASWYTEAMYASSAALTRHLCDTLGIAADREHILAHSEVPGADHTDPGPNWDWDHYLALVTGGGQPDPDPEPEWTVRIDNTDAGFAASANWGDSRWSSTKIGTDYRFAEPAFVSDAAWFSAELPADGRYRVEVHHPADPGYNSATPFVVVTTGGDRTVPVDQRSGGGWRSIGSFPMAAGRHRVVGVSRWTSGSGLVVADAVRISKVG